MDEMECTCVVDYDGDCSDIWTEVERRARKIHRCSECHRDIVKGEQYTYVSSLYDGSWSHYHVCLGCYRLAHNIYCNGVTFGRLAEDVWEALGVDIVTGETMSD